MTEGDDDDSDDDLLDERPRGAAAASGLAPVLAVSANWMVTSTAVRLDVEVAAQVPGLSRAGAQRAITEGRVTVGGSVVHKLGHKLRGGELVAVLIPPPAPVALVAEEIPLDVLYEDGDVIVINKPAAMVVHPAPGHATGTLVNALLYHCGDLAGLGGELRPGIVHRLDKGTSGVMIASKHDRAHAGLAHAFANKATMLREYVAICAPPPPRPELTLRTLYGRHPVDRKRFSSKVTRGKSAVTHISVDRNMGATALLRCRLDTGRTHQIRVHCADHGFPLLGDPVYGARLRDPRLAELAARLGRQALHAEKLELDHPMTGERLRFCAPPPPDFAELLAQL